MSATVDNLSLNKKGTKVKVIGKPKYYNLLGTLVQWTPSFIWLSFKFDLFTFENEGYAMTGWGIIGVSMLFLAFRQKIKDKFKEYEEMFGTTYSRVKSGNIALGIATVMFLVYFVSFSLFGIFAIYGVSTYLSLFLYKPYDELTIKRRQMQKMLDEKNQTEDFERLQQKYNELQNNT